MKKLNKKVAVAMSGGVDSSVAAVLLKKRGYDIIGFFMHFWKEKEGNEKFNKCCSSKALDDARRIARMLDFPLYTLNFEIPFKYRVVDQFLESYKRGDTPNPCIRCNEFIKFDKFLNKIKKYNCDFIATGHYAQVKKDKNGIYHLHSGNDILKDQSYFLYRLNQKILSQTIFPIGHLKKTQVRELAEKYKIPVAQKKDSQEVCFVMKDLESFLTRYLKLKPGDIIDIETKKILGKHKGLPIYTIGQRKGIGLGEGPWYVVKKDSKKNILYITNNSENKYLFTKKISLRKTHWVSGSIPKLPLIVDVKSRYSQILRQGILKQENEKIYIEMLKPQFAVTPGQSAVCYIDDEIIGGGIIV